MPDFPGDLLYTGIAQDAYKQNMAYGAQSDGAYKLNDSNTVRAGLFLQSDHSISDTSSQVLVTDNTGVPLERRSDDHHRQRRQDGMDLQRLSAG